MEQPIYYLFIYIVVTDVVITGPDIIKPLLLIAIVVHDVIMEPCWCQGVTIALMLWAVI